LGFFPRANSVIAAMKVFMDCKLMREVEQPYNALGGEFANDSNVSGVWMCWY
jgi:hypothetical protein